MRYWRRDKLYDDTPKMNWRWNEYTRKGTESTHSDELKINKLKI